MFDLCNIEFKKSINYTIANSSPITRSYTNLCLLKNINNDNYFKKIIIYIKFFNIFVFLNIFYNIFKNIFYNFIFKNNKLVINFN